MTKQSRRFLAFVLACALGFSLLAGCGSSAPATSSSTPAAPASSAAPAPAAPSQAEPAGEDLVKLAQAEGTLVIYSASSRHSKAGEDFEAKYGIKVEATQLKDGEMIEKVSKEAQASVAGADLIFAQDGGRVYGELIAPGFVYNYVPESLQGILDPADQNPLVFEFCNKVIVYNNEKDAASPITNVWQLADPEWKGRVQMKDAFQEGVNMNFLTMITNPELSDALAASYKKLYGKDLELTTPNAGYEWIKALYANGLVLGTSDTTISEAVGMKGQSTQLAGLFTFNKVRLAGEKDLALDVCMEVEPFAGFYYPMYALMPKNSAHPNAAKLFIEFVLTEEGYGPWIDSPGDYSPNPEIPVSEGDISIREWDKILVREDPQWCYENRAAVEDFINNL